jgi:hypothetical protein
MDYRFKESIPIIQFPKQIIDEDRGLLECCCAFDVIADLTSGDSWKNDKKHVFAKKALQGDTIEFEMYKCGVLITNYGVIGIYPNEPLAVGFIYDWNEVLQNEGIGIYTIKISFTIAGITDSFDIGAFNLQNYNFERLDETCRIRSFYDSYNVELDFDFTGSNAVDDIRFGGYFGLMKPNTVVKSLIDKGRKVIKTTRQHLPSYQLFAEPLSKCLSAPVLFHLLNEDDCYITDHNISNHSYQYLDFPVSLTGDVDCEYPANARIMKLTAKFGDKTENKKSMYNVNN